MLNHIYAGVQTLLQAKVAMHPDNPMLQGMTTRELIDVGGFSPSSLHMALQEKALAARYGIYNMTPNKKRNALWGFSQEVLDKANGLPFDHSAGIDPKVQAAEVQKLVSDCPDSTVHDRWNQLEEIRMDYLNNCGILYDDVKDMLNKIIGGHYTNALEEAKNVQSE